MKIPFNRPCFQGKELAYIAEAINEGKISGDGKFSAKCHAFFNHNYHFSKSLLTTSCTDALEMAAILCEIKPGDEVIMPSYTFVSTANAFILRGAQIVFADSEISRPHIDAESIESLITNKTKAIVPVHYAGIACEMSTIMNLADKYHLTVIEDAAQAIHTTYLDKPLGGIGHLSAFSFHETKNIICGEGGLLVINDSRFAKRAEVIREKGTNRSAFFRGEVDKYGWIDVGSSFLPSDILAAFLYAQLENLESILLKRKYIWNLYQEGLYELFKSERFKIPIIPDYSSNNYHMFYLVCQSLKERTSLIEHLKCKEIYAAFHYQSLHKSPFFHDKHDGRELPNADTFSDCLVRLPLFSEMTTDDAYRVIQEIKDWSNKIAKNTNRNL